MRKNTIIFDLDGTLLNTLEDLMDSVNYCLAQYHLADCTLAQIRNYVGNGVRILLERAVNKQVSDEKFEEMYELFVEYYQKHSQVKTKPYEGILELLSSLHQKGYKMAIVSNKFQAGVEELREVFFASYIPIGIGESETVKRKPAPDSVYAALKKLGSSAEESIYIGDSEVDYKTAENAGVDLIAVTWGFRDKEVLEELGAKVFADSPKEVLSILEGLG